MQKFKYLGHIISNNFTDDEDIDREIRNMFVRCNTLACKFVQCSLRVKIELFKTFCLCFYDIALWRVFKCGTIQKFRSCYHKCIKLFFKYRRSDSVTGILLVTGLPSFDTVLFNAQHVFGCKWNTCNNEIVNKYRVLEVPYYKF